MHTLKYVHWKDGDAFLGYLVDYPDYLTQGISLEDLKELLAELFRDIASGELPAIRKVDELVIP
jgi:predicted RNase H-like HicB family nuclease